MSDWSKTQKIILLYTLWLSPPTRSKEATWEAFTNNKSMAEAVTFEINERILSETDETFVNWRALEDFAQDQVNALK